MSSNKVTYRKTEPILANNGAINGSGSITIENNPCTFDFLPYGSPVQALSVENTFKLIKGFESFLGAASATQKVKKVHMLGITDALTLPTGGAVTVLSIDYTTSTEYDTVVFSASVTLVSDTIYSQVPTAGKASLTTSETPIDNSIATLQARAGVLGDGRIDSVKTTLPVNLIAASMVKGVTNVANLFA